MATLRIHPRILGTPNKILDKLNKEVVDVQSVESFYIPRTLVAEDKILGEDRLSKFKHSYPINVYIETNDAYMGQNSFASKFGLQIESSATVIISRSGWIESVGRFGETILPNRPTEGDLLYIPMTKGLFEISFVNHQMPFYQLGDFYTYKLNIELFRYSSENISTGNAAIDAFETVHTTDVVKQPEIDNIKRGADNSKFKKRTDNLILDMNNPFGDL